MQHVAIMKKRWNMIPKIVSGEKTVESRWYKNKSAPWGKIAPGDTIYFKNSGEKVIARAKVSRVLQFSLESQKEAQSVVEKYGKKIGLAKIGQYVAKKCPRYCILVFLEKAKLVSKPFTIDKRGFGSAAAWITVLNIEKLIR